MDANDLLPGETPPRPASAARSERARLRGVVDDARARALRAEAPRALRDLLAAFHRADALAEGRLLAGQERALYPGLVTVLLRLVVILFAEAHGLLPLAHPRYAAASLTRLRADLAALDPSRSGAIEDDRAAWARVTALFRLLHDGLPDALPDALPARRGHLFAPDAYPFLEGRPPAAPDARGDAPAGADLPRLPRLPGLDDAAVRRVLDRLLAPGGEPLQYRDLEVEHLGSFYEGLMGFEVQIARGPSLALQPHDAVVDLEALLARPGDARLAFLRDAIGLEPRGKTGAAIAAATTLEALAAALSRRASPAQPDLIPAGARYLQPGEERRRLGAHYTTREITGLMVHRALAPLLRPDQTPEEILALKICDPAMGSGAFLVEACRQLADHLVRAAPPDHPATHHARRLVAQRCLYGVDRNPVAVDLARLSLWLVAGAPDEPFSFVDHALRHGDALLGLGRAEIAAATQGPATPASPAAPRAPRTPPTPEEMRSLGDALLAAALTAPDPRSRARVIREIAQPWKRTRLAGQRARLDPEATPEGLAAGSDPAIPEQLEAFRRRYAPFHWELELPEVFASGGFDAFVGNPPWVAYVGRAAQPIADELRDYFTGTSPAFSGYRTLQGLFVHRAATLLRPGGRLGLVLPTSMSDLSGYEPARRAHDALCACDDALPDFGDRAFDGVFQPSMGLLSTRRADPAPVSRAGPWPLARSDLDPDAAALLDHLSALPPLPPHLFGERGFQTTADDVRHLRPFTPLGAPDAAGATHVRAGGDIEPFLRRPPRFSCDPAVFGGRFRPEADWKAVRLLIRQTARYPIAALSDGAAFRNSILAGFADERHSEHFLLAWLNSTPIRWFHYMRHRDARQGMPQVKIAHLRALPAPPADAPAVQALAALGRALGERNAGITPADQEEIDRLAADALALDERARAKVAAWRTGPRP